MLQETNATGSSIKWALYHEREGNPDTTGSSDPTVEQIGADLDYMKTNYAADPAYLKIDGKPVIFVYADGADGCPMADRWTQANTAERGFYVVLKVFARLQDLREPASELAPVRALEPHRPPARILIRDLARIRLDRRPSESGRSYLARDLAEVPGGCRR